MEHLQHSIVAREGAAAIAVPVPLCRPGTGYAEGAAAFISGAQSWGSWSLQSRQHCSRGCRPYHGQPRATAERQRGYSGPATVAATAAAFGATTAAVPDSAAVAAAAAHSGAATANGTAADPLCRRSIAAWLT
mmetsp:Transcript_123058/g.274831  ORF Transcript_123058/g.274831 Transcript_123058/m.274831 type:complete len:133 (+) Transcript_123058:336-734(+)